MYQKPILSVFESVCGLGNSLATPRLFKRAMVDFGAVLVGCGMYGTVWKYRGRYFKINSNFQGIYDGFYSWILACKTASALNKALPRFGHCVVNHGRYCVEIEPLAPYMGNLDNLDLSTGDLAGAIKLAKYAFAKANGVHSTQLQLDLTQSNFMVRGGCIVLNDPIPYRP